MSTSVKKKGNKKEDTQVMSSDNGQEEEEQQQSENAGVASASTPRRQQRAQPARRSTRSRKRRASPANGGVENSDGGGDDDDDNDSNKPTKKKRRRAVEEEVNTNDADMNDTTAADDNDDDTDAPVKKKSAAAKDNKNHVQKDDDDEMEDNENDQEEDRKMPAGDGKVNGHHHQDTTTAAAASTEASEANTMSTTTTATPPSVSFVAPPSAAAASTSTANTTTTTTRVIPVLPMATNLRLPHQHTPGKPLHETEILRQPPVATALHQQQQQQQDHVMLTAPPPPATAASSMRLHLEASATMANSPFPITTPQHPPKNGGTLENGSDGRLNDAHQTTTADIGDHADDQWHSPTAASLQQQQQPLEEPQQQQQQQQRQGSYLWKSTLVWCLLILLMQMTLGSFWINPFLSTIVNTSKFLSVKYKHIAWWGGHYFVSQERLVILVGVTIIPPRAEDLMTISSQSENENNIVIVASTDDDDDIELDKELEMELATEEQQDVGAELDDQVDDPDVENAWMLELEKEYENLIDDVEDFEIELPEEEPDDFGILDDDGEFDIASIQDNDDGEEEDDDISIQDLLLEAEQEKDEYNDDDEEYDGIFNMTEETIRMKERLDQLEEKRKVVLDKRRKIRHDLERDKKALQTEKDALFTRVAASGGEVDDDVTSLDSVYADGLGASEVLNNKLADMNVLIKKLSNALAVEDVAGSYELEYCLEHMAREYDGLLIDVNRLELWNVPVEDDEAEQECSSDDFTVFGRDQAWRQIRDFQEKIVNESHDMLNDETLRKSIEDWVTAYAATQPMPTRQKQKAIDSKAKNGSRTQNGPTANKIKYIIAARLEHERADQTGRVDYAALYNGGSVIRTGERATSPSLVDSLPIVNRLGAALRMRFYGHGPEAALTPTHPTTALGQCWAFGPDPRGDRFSSFATLSIRLAKPVFIEKISIEHPSSLQVQDKIRTAIRSFRVLGFEDEQAQGTAWRLGTYRYEISDENTVNNMSPRPRQEYDIPNNVNGVDIPRLRSISLAIDSNWGMSYSCLYRVRVHGSER